LDHADVLAEQAATLRAERETLAERLRALPQCIVFPSAANFLLVRVPDSTALFNRLRDGGILVKNLHGWNPLLDNCLRLSIGTPEENAALFGVLQSVG
ncbi:MAG: aminotransferase class I/II-fold pyridoxal phosphate-dependent enzyme, partial [Betaproteobacteria bacterium]